MTTKLAADVAVCTAPVATHNNKSVKVPFRGSISCNLYAFYSHVN